MRYVRFEAEKGPCWGRLSNEEITPLSGPPYAGGKPAGIRIALSDVHLLAPVEPSKVLCVGLNYVTHVEDGAGPDALVAGIIGSTLKDRPKEREPILFLKAPTAIVGPRAAIVLPPETRRADFEAELALVIGQKIRRPTREQAAAAIFAYTCANDVSARDIQDREGQWMRAKSFDTFCPVGPWLETEFDPADRTLEGICNGQVRQHTSTRFLIADPVELVHFAAQAMTLLPGDIFLTGTPAGIAALAPGDRFVVSIQGIGELENRVVAEKDA